MRSVFRPGRPMMQQVCSIVMLSDWSGFSSRLEETDPHVPFEPYKSTINIRISVHVLQHCPLLGGDDDDAGCDAMELPMTAELLLMLAAGGGDRDAANHCHDDEDGCAAA